MNIKSIAWLNLNVKKICIPRKMHKCMKLHLNRSSKCRSIAIKGKLFIVLTFLCSVKFNSWETCLELPSPENLCLCQMYECRSVCNTSSTCLQTWRIMHTKVRPLSQPFFLTHIKCYITSGNNTIKHHVCLA